MRITGGEFRGRVLRAPKAGMRPTQDRVRQALFNILMGRVDGARFLDLYAGSGAVGLEALSRGAVSITWVERERNSLAMLRKNVAAFQASTSATAPRTECAGRAGVTAADCRVVADEAVRFIKRGARREAYDLIYADPPYVDSRAGQAEALLPLLEAIEAGDVLAKAGLFVYESAGGQRAQPITLPEGWRQVMQREYGRTRLRVFDRAPHEQWAE